MHLFTDLFLLQRIDHLIRTRATGTPLQLASRLETSERKAYRLIEQLREHGLPIAYDKDAHTYYYTQPVKLAFNIAVDGKNLMMITGGEK